MRTDSFDLVVVGSGPVGAAIARTVFDQRTTARILMVEVGPQVIPLVAGTCARNLPGAERVDAEYCSQGPRPRESKPVPGAPGGQLPRPGTFLVDDAADFANPVRNMPGAVMSACVGGQGTHWSGMCPRPGNTERIPFIGAELDDALSAAERFLRVTAEAYPATAARDSVEKVLGGHFNAARPHDRWVQAMPMAATPVAGGRPHWWGADAILGDLADPATRPARFELRSRTLARRLLHDGSTVEGIELKNVSTGTLTTVSAKAVAVAADPFRTPQLLWASGIRPTALGHYLNDQPRVTGVVTMHDRLFTASEQLPETDNQRELVTGISWIPFHSPDFPFSGTIALHEAPVPSNGTTPDPPTISLGCFTTKQLRYDDRVELSETTVDPWGMPAITIHYDFTERDRAAVEEAKKIIEGLMPLLGEPVGDGTVHTAPAGSSIHYQGTVRMGSENDGTSVCDTHGKVWETANLYVAGNGVIPTETACNPTLTSVALAIRSGQHVAAML